MKLSSLVLESFVAHNSSAKSDEAWETRSVCGLQATSTKLVHWCCRAQQQKIPYGARTRDPQIKSLMLYLSVEMACAISITELKGLNAVVAPQCTLTEIR